MSERSRRPTDETGTEVRDPERRRAVFGALPGTGAAAAAAAASPEPWEQGATEVTPRPGPLVEQATPTHVDPLAPGRPHEQGTPTALMARPERSEPIRVISMKDPVARDRNPASGEPRVPLHIQLRSIAEVAGLHDPPSGLGRLAPPRDPRRARSRRRRDNALWACVAIALACGISLAIWLIAGR